MHKILRLIESFGYFYHFYGVQNDSIKRRSLKLQKLFCCTYLNWKLLRRREANKQLSFLSLLNRSYKHETIVFKCTNAGTYFILLTISCIHSHLWLWGPVLCHFLVKTTNIIKTLVVFCDTSWRSYQKEASNIFDYKFYRLQFPSLVLTLCKNVVKFPF